ncbi:NADH-quinone oxidoreductase subunit C [Candidatus Protochlamydia amoebophila]|uniref:NADH-quinone oxidoreductase subunit C n=1 Tax=Protochlamydia amoebophila (strain UWE25) TaxID=264201 RepID=Q6MDR4_PARUW|nr:NADH-quinone oxidoreductase subunit C [Candidatus Protochlamydia amoebophila]CAF23285.1 unnamed protein product [Candidatus Protochlamydia amoebophila UWE25]
MTSQIVLDHIKKNFQAFILNQTLEFGETTFEVNRGGLKIILNFLKIHEDCQFEVLMDLTAVDYLFPVKRTQILYFLQNFSRLDRIRIGITIERGEMLPTVTDLWEGANWYERELFDMFGVEFKGHPELSRILMPDHWLGHPMLRDYALTEEVVQFKNNVKPKVPSQIISYDKSK